MTTETLEVTQQQQQPAVQQTTQQPAPQQSVDDSDSRLAELTKELEAARSKLSEIETAKADAERKKAIEQGELQKLLDSDSAKHASELKARDEQIRNYQRTIADQQREALIKDSAAELMLGDWQWLGELMLKDRIGVTVDDKGNAKTIVYDAKKEKSNLTVDKLKEELRADKRIENFLKGNSVGSGANVKDEPMLNTYQPTTTQFGGQPQLQQQSGGGKNAGILGADAESVSKWVQGRIKARR